MQGRNSIFYVFNRIFRAVCLYAGVLIVLGMMGCSKVSDNGDKNKGSEAIISGTLINSTGKAVAGALVSVDADSGATVVSDGDGKFRLTISKPGELQLKIYHADYAPIAAPKVSVVLGQTLVLDSAVRMKWNYYVIQGKVKSSSAQALEGAGISIAKSTLTALSNESGEFEINRIPKNVSSIVLLAARSGIGFTSQTISSLKGDTITIADLVLSQEGITVRGTVYGTDIKPVAGVVVQAVGSGIQDSTDSQGEYVLHNVPSNQEGLVISVPKLEAQGLVGSVMGVKASGNVIGMDIYLREAAKPQNGMILESADQIFEQKTTSDEIVLEVFPEITEPARRIASYTWKTSKNITLGTSSEPRLKIKQSELLAALAKTNKNSAVQKITIIVEATNDLGQLSSTVSFMVQITSPQPIITEMGILQQTSNLVQSVIDTVYENNLVNFRAVALDPIGGLKQIVWYFGNNDSLVLADTALNQIGYLYDAPGTYQVIVKFIDTDNNIALDTITVVVVKSDLITPDLIAPFNGYIAGSKGEKIDLSWSRLPMTGVKYKVYADYRTNPPRTLIDSAYDVSTVSFIPDSGRSYYWFVEASKDGQRTTSLVGTFKGYTGIQYLDILKTPAKDSMLPDWSTILAWKYKAGYSYQVEMGLNPDSLGTLKSFSSQFENDANDNTLYIVKVDSLKGHSRYYWRVKEKGTGTPNAESRIGSFLTPNHIPSIPVRRNVFSTVKPAQPVNFRWFASHDGDKDPMTYLLYLDTQNPPTHLHASIKNDTSYNENFGFINGETYYWRLRATDGRDTVTNDTIFSFKTQSAISILASPASDSLLSDFSVNLNWVKENKADYKVLLGTDSAAISQSVLRNYGTYYYTNVGNASLLYTTASGLDGNRTYYWQVIRKDSLGVEQPSQMWKFRTPNHTPALFYISTPANGSVQTIGRSITFKWTESVDQDIDATLKYLVYLDVKNPPVKLLTTVNDTSEVRVTSTGIDSARTYFWRVAATDGYDTVFSSNVLTMTGNHEPSITTTIKDLRDSFVVGEVYTDTIKAIDADAADAIYYYKSANPAVQDLNITYYTGIFTFTPSFTGDTTLSIYVTDNKGANDTISWPVHVKAAALDIQLLPAQNDTVNGGSVEFRWKYGANLTYKVVGGIDSTAMDTLPGYVYANGTSYHTVTSSLKGHSKWFWKVVVKGNASTWTSPMRSFFTRNQKPSIPSYAALSPYNRSIAPSTDINFTFPVSTDADGDALRYHIYLDSGTAQPTTRKVSIDTNYYGLAGGIAKPGTYGWRLYISDGFDTVQTNYNTEFYVNRPASFTVTSGDLTATGYVGNTYRDTLHAVDPDGNTRNYAFIQRPTGMKFSATTSYYSTDSIIDWKPTLAQVGTHTVSLYVEDYRGPYEVTTRDTITWTVTVPAPAGAWDVMGTRVFNGLTSTQMKIAYQGDTAYAAVQEGATGISVWQSTDGLNWLSLGTARPTATTIEGNFRLITKPSGVYIMYKHAVSDSIYVRRYNGSTWDTVGNASLGYNYYGDQNIALVNHNDTLYAAFPESASPYRIIVKRFNGSAWETVGTTVSTVQAGGVDLASDGTTLFCGYRVSSSGAMEIKKLSGSNWLIAGSGLYTGSIGALRLAAYSGSVYTAFYKTTANTISVQKTTGNVFGYLGATDFGTVQASYAGGGLGGLKIDPSSGDVLLAWQDSEYFATVHRYSGIAWNPVGYNSFSQSLGASYYVDLALRPGGQPVVIFQDQASNPDGATVMKFTP